MKFRNFVLRLHGSIGIVMGLLLTVISLTGGSIVFYQELDRALNRSLYHVTPQTQQVSLDTMVALVQTARPDLPLGFIEIPKKPDESYVINQKIANKHRLQTFVNPYTGDLLGSRIWEYSLVGFLYTLHHDLFVGKVGEIIVGVTGVLLLLMALSGMLLWTGWRKLMSGLIIRWQAPLPLIGYDIHKVGGILSSLFLSITAFTGVVMVIVHLLPMFNHPPDMKPIPQKPPVALSKLIQKADVAIPEGKTTSIEFPEHDNQKLIITKKLPNQETGRFDLSFVELDRYSSEVVEVNKVIKADPFFAFLVAIANLHFGTFGGLPTRILYVFVGFMPTLLLITGLINWKRRRLLTLRPQRGRGAEGQRGS
ncbi:PepSY-associated TM helix domain-containing protein [Argonema antarcticum]|uniref:PepSY-associated TM helix domain-containing protein n=1 Tax=Argonema antarcticum TaxID=2942763 RepID=UPI0020119C96|nr:PepSY-associated TM helix domain-containing protein [Argonema antarcticum]MCL1472554.1 PepSY domain-containing protein [Argonema antarcticum A004/B2]